MTKISLDHNYLKYDFDWPIAFIVFHAISETTLHPILNSQFERKAVVYSSHITLMKSAENSIVFVACEFVVTEKTKTNSFQDDVCCYSVALSLSWMNHFQFCLVFLFLWIEIEIGFLPSAPFTRWSISMWVMINATIVADENQRDDCTFIHSIRKSCRKSSMHGQTCFDNN